MDQANVEGAPEFTLLGPVRGRRGPVELDLGGPQQRALLAMLLLAEGRPVHVAELVEGLWAADAPKAGNTTVRTYVFRLRSVLEPDRRDGGLPRLLVSSGSSYALRLPGGSVDVALARQETDAAAEASGAGDTQRARDLLHQALGRWRGTPLDGLAGPFAATWRDRLTRWRLDAVESRARIDLRSGERGPLAESIEALAAATTTHPLRESLWELLMRAQYRVGRTAEALETFRRARAVLVQETGIEPNPRLVTVHERILRADPGLLSPRRESGAAQPSETAVRQDTGGPEPEGDVRDTDRSAIPVPAQLPPDLVDFTGRERAVGELRELLLAPPDAALRVCAVSGIGGAGKTTLAVRVAHEVRAVYPDGQLFVDLQGAGPRPAETGVVLGGLLRALGVADRAIPAGLEERSGLFRSLVAGRRMLLILDNAADARQIRALLPGEPRCAVIVTSRGHLGGEVAAAHTVQLGGFVPEESRALLSAVVGAHRVHTESADADAVLDLCGHLPLAVRVIACRLQARPATPLAECVGRMADERGRLAQLSTGDLDVESSFRVGYDQLEPAQARAFRLLSVPDAPTITLSSAAPLIGSEEAEAELLLDELVRRGLLQSPAFGLYRLHDLVRLFARRRCEETESEEDVLEALLRLFDHVLAMAVDAYRAIRPGHSLAGRVARVRADLPALRTGPEPAPRVTAVRPRVFRDAADAHAWFDRECRFLLKLLWQAASGTTRLVERAAWLLLGLDPLLERGFLWPDMLDLGRRLVDACRRTHLPEAESAVLYMLAGALWQTSRSDEATGHVGRAERLARAYGEPLLLAEILTVSALVEASRDGQSPRVVAILREAAEIHGRTGNLSGEANVCGNLAAMYLAAGAAADAVRVSAAGLLLFRGLGDSMGEAQILVHHGTARRMLGDFHGAAACYGRALVLARSLGMRFLEAAALCMVAEAKLLQDEIPEAIRLAESARELSGKIGFTRREVRSLTVLGRALGRQARYEEATGVLLKAVDLSNRTGGMADEGDAAARALADTRSAAAALPSSPPAPARAG